jgi:hypothetical protein
MKTPKRRSTRRPPRAPKGGWLVRVDQRPLRRKAASECSRALSQLEKARAEWRRFDREDQPAYERWLAGRFGAVLTELRELEQALREKERLIDEVEIEYAWIGARNFRAAYLSVMRRRNAPVPSRTVPPEDADCQAPRDFSEFTREEKHELFEDFLDGVLGIDAEALSKREYQRMFREFEAAAREAQRPPEPPRPPVRPEDARIKEVYRLLVRRLHPDTRADRDAEVSALWHEVQEAYLAGQLERLEMLLALTDIREKSAGAHTSLFQMREVLTELRRAFATVQKNLRAARKEPAWRFARRADREALAARLERRFRRDLLTRQRRLRRCEALIASWARPGRAQRRAASDRQVEFAF